MGIVDESGKTPTVALREVGENLERLKHQSEDLLLLVEDEIRYIAKGGKPEVRKSQEGGRQAGREGGREGGRGICVLEFSNKDVE